MKIQITENKDLFISLFQLLKGSFTNMNITFDDNKMHIQGMDKAHVCLFDLNLSKLWFYKYSADIKEQLSFDTNLFFSIINVKSDGNICITIETTKASEDILQIKMESMNQKEKLKKLNLLLHVLRHKWFDKLIIYII
jgi:hypothetical protein